MLRHAVCATPFYARGGLCQEQQPWQGSSKLLSKYAGQSVQSGKFGRVRPHTHTHMTSDQFRWVARWGSSAPPVVRAWKTPWMAVSQLCDLYSTSCIPALT
ncbi:unnamed protein product, partial [Ectocarpus sp. 8 AP-2014]